MHRADIQEFLEPGVQAAHADAGDAGQLLGADGFVRVGLQIVLHAAHMARQHRGAAAGSHAGVVVRMRGQQGGGDQLLHLMHDQLVRGQIRMLRRTIQQIGHQAAPRRAVAPMEPQLETQRTIQRTAQLAHQRALQQRPAHAKHELIAVVAPAHGQVVIGTDHGRDIGRGVHLLGAAGDTGRSRQRHLHQEKILQRARPDLDLGAVTQAVQRDVAQRLVMHARVQALHRAHDAQLVRPHHAADHRARLVQIARGEQLLRRQSQDRLDARRGRRPGRAGGGQRRIEHGWGFLPRWEP
ncbi:hypothetical protein D3C71_1372710 [compost metagenome]